MNRQPLPNHPHHQPNQQGRAGPANPAQRQHRQQANAQRAQQQQIINAVPRYQATRQYLALCERKFTSAAQIARANRWILANQAQIDPNELQICTECDFGDNFTICACAIAPIQQQHQQAVPNIHAGLPNTITVDRTWTDWFWGKENSTFSFQDQNNHNLDEFSNSNISDAHIMPELYNYITSSMYVSYVNSSGNEDRRLRIEHCKRLAGRYMETHKLDTAADTFLNNRVKFTVQRSCDQIENDMLYKEHRPMHESNFWKAWWPRFGMAVLFLSLISSIFVVTVAMSSSPQETTVPKYKGPAALPESMTPASTGTILPLGRTLESSSLLDQVMEHFVNAAVKAVEQIVRWTLGSEYLKPLY